LACKLHSKHNAIIDAQQDIKSLGSVEIRDKFGSITSYLVVVDGSNALKFYCQRNLAHFVLFPTNITSVRSVVLALRVR
jgi:hypothetical protein